MRITFDSNVWEEVVRPDTRPGDPERQKHLIQIHEALKAGRISGFICETVTTLEGLRRGDRAEFLAKQEVGPRLLDSVQPDGTTHTIAMIAPDQSHRPALKPILTDRLKEAVALGVQVMGVPRYSELVLPSEFYANEFEKTVEKIGKAMFEIEQRGVGRAQLTMIGRELAIRHPESGHTYFDIPDVPLTDEDRRKVAAAVAEWADGDTIACHIGYGNDLFCSGDKGGKAGARTSILNHANRAWLTSTYGLQFKSVAELAAILSPRM
jgi:hypothetical protein